MRAFLTMGLFVVLVTSVPAAQTPAAAGGAIIGTGAFTVFVENMDRSLAFYHDVFGMEVPPLQASGERPYNNANPRLFAMFDIPGARERHQSARAAGTRVAVEVMDVQDVPHTTLDLRVQDAGTATLVLVVRDIDTMLARLARANVPIVTRGATPVALTGGGRAVLVRDVDNRFIQIEQPPSPPNADSPNDVLDMRVSIAVSDLNRTAHIYRDVLGFDVKSDSAFVADVGRRSLTGLARAEVRTARARAKGSALELEFVEYRGVDRKPLHMKIQDRGAARLQLRAQHIDAVVDAVKRAGLAVISAGGVAVPIPPNLKGALVADPDNFFLTLFEPCEACAPRTPGR